MTAPLPPSGVSDELPEVALILRDLINAPSPNPPGDCEAMVSACLA